LFETNAAMRVEMICWINCPKPKFIHTTANDKNPQAQILKNAARKYRLNKELKYLYKKQTFGEKFI
jgi:hypothetical protein